MPQLNYILSIVCCAIAECYLVLLKPGRQNFKAISLKQRFFYARNDTKVSSLGHNFRLCHLNYISIYRELVKHFLLDRIRNLHIRHTHTDEEKAEATLVSLHFIPTVFHHQL